MLTDSGGYQVFSLEPKVTDDGVRVPLHLRRRTHLLTPEGAVATQELLGADIQMVLDVCAAAARRPRRAAAEAVDRTAAVGGAGPGCPPAHRRPGAVRHRAGRSDPRPARRVRPTHRGAGLRRLRDRRAVGGRDPRPRCCRRSTRRSRELPEDQPRYLMGVGDPVSIVGGGRPGRGHVRLRAADPARPSRHAAHRRRAAEHQAGRVRPQRRAGRAPPAPCATCARYSRGYLRHLMAVGEPAGATLCTVHNLTWMLDLVGRIRSSIAGGTLGGPARRAGRGPRGHVAGRRLKAASALRRRIPHRRAGSRSILRL